MIALRLLVFALGVGAVMLTLTSAVKTFVLPRSAPDAVAAVVFRALRLGFNGLMRLVARTYERRDAVMAFFAPTALLALLPTWLGLIAAGYTAMYWALGQRAWHDAFVLSGSSLLTLGFATIDHVADRLPTLLLVFSEGTLGLILVAMLIAYLPTIYAAFARREAAVGLLEVRAGSPPSAVEMIERYHRLQGLDTLGPLWSQWEVWFTELAESHTSLAALVFFRSPHPQQSWVTAAGAVLDAAALVNAAVDTPHDLQADLTLRAGYLALRHIADFFDVGYDAQPRPTDPISIQRAEFDAAWEHMAQRGVPLRPDREQAWRDFAGWRVNYDTVLIALAHLTMAPRAPWSSDRPAAVGRGQRMDRMKQMKG
jgi:hypothetical protein